VSVGVVSGRGGSLPKSSSYSDLVHAAGDFSALQELSGSGATRPPEEEDDIIDRVEGILRARLCPQAPAGGVGRVAAAALPSREFLRTCVRVWEYREEDAGTL
jgi:hypothetical protein